MLIPIPYVHAGMGLLTVFLSVPLMMKKIPMNRAYGIRIKKAFVSDRNWYEVNAYGGRLFLVFGIFLVGFSYFSYDFAPSPASPWAPVFLVIPLILIVPIVILINLYARKLPDL